MQKWLGLVSGFAIALTAIASTGPTIAVARISSAHPTSASQPDKVREVLNPNLRATLTGSAATDLIDFCGRLAGTIDDSWVLSNADLDEIDQLLAPLLMTDLRSEGSKYFPADYYRQYSVGSWKDSQVVYINGFHKHLVETREEIHNDSQSWKTSPVRVSDGGSGYWCAIFVKKNGNGRFVTIKQEGRPPRTVAFHGYA